MVLRYVGQGLALSWKARLLSRSGPAHYAEPDRLREESSQQRGTSHAVHITVVAGAFTHDGGRAGMEEILAEAPDATAVMAPNDFAALGALEAADHAGIDVPGRLSVTGYDNIAIARMGRIDLTTVEQPAEEMGRTAVQLLRGRIEDGRSTPEHLVLPPKLITGTTTAPPR